MKIANYFLQGVVDHSGLPQWLVEQSGMESGEGPENDLLILWINSPGGDVLAAIESINLIKASPVPVVTIINGAAESAGLLISSSGHYRLVFERSFGMAHHFSTGAEGSYHELQDSMKHNGLVHDIMVSLFKENSSATTDIIDDKFLGRKNTYMSAKELVKYGLADEVVKPGPKFQRRIQAYGNSKKASKAKKHLRRKGDRALTDSGSEVSV